MVAAAMSMGSLSRGVCSQKETKVGALGAATDEGRWSRQSLQPRATLTGKGWVTEVTGSDRMVSRGKLR